MADKQGQRCHTRHMWQRVRDWAITTRTLVAIDDRECKHDGAGPQCGDCFAVESGW